MDKWITGILTVYKEHLPIDEKQEAVLQYALGLLMGSVLGYGWALVVAWLFGTFSMVLTTMMTVSFLRVFSGGAHCSSMKNCILYGGIIMNILGLWATAWTLPNELILPWVLGIFFFSLWCIHRYAPADTPGKPIQSKQQKHKLRVRSFLVVILWCFIIVGWYLYFHQLDPLLYASSIGILWQSFTLTKAGYGFCHKADSLLNLS